LNVSDGLSGFQAALEPANRNLAVFQIYVFQFESADLACTHAVFEAKQDHRKIAAVFGRDS
jgi:hypothetical protein